jgi:hypothetical protein
MLRVHFVSMKKRAIFIWLLPLLLHSGSALAWGLETHIYFSQLLIWAIPLADVNFRRAARRFPQLVMAGACLPDLSLVGGAAFHHTHGWQTCERLLGDAETDEEKAVALGYASHLLADVVAHNHFVPAHQALWLDHPLLTHVMAEWAMDSHIRPHLFNGAAHLLDENRRVLAVCATKMAPCTLEQAERALKRLAAADRLLRFSRLPQILYRLFSVIDRRVEHHFDYYIGQTTAHFGRINGIIEGAMPALQAEPEWEREVWKIIQNSSLGHLLERMPLPHHLFHHNPKEALAILAPIAAPASTSVG